jgi:hypothetical protein
MKTIGRLFGLLLVTWFATMAVAASMAMQRKKAIVAEPPDEADDEVALTAIFESLDFESHAPAFRGGTLECWFGGGSVDLRGATLDPAGATLTVKAIFGGGQILVPDSWVVESRVSGIGGTGDARQTASAEAAAGAPTLVIEGLVVFGGFGIMSRDPRPEAHEAPEIHEAPVAV